MSKDEVKRSRNHSLITYLNKTDIENVLQKHLIDIKDYAYICHDKDVSKQGTLKAIHFHIVLHLYNPKSTNVVRSWFYDTSLFSSLKPIPNTLSQPVIDIDGILDYLTHCNQPDKYQYDKSLIITNNLDWLDTPTEDDKDSKSYSIVQDILEGCSMRQLAFRYGREFIINHKVYMDFASLILTEDKSNDS